MNQKPLTQEHISHLMALMQSGKANDAIKRGGQLLRQYPDALVLYRVIAQAHYLSGRMKQALQTLEAAYQINPKDIETLGNYGLLCLEAGLPEHAANAFEQITQINPNVAEAYENLGIISLMIGRLDDAESRFRRALKLNPELPVSLNNLGNIMIGRGKLEEAEARCRQALEIDPDMAEAHNTLGAIYTRMGRIDDAMACIDRAETLQPNMPEVYFNRGLAHTRIGEFKQAEKCFRKTIKLSPSHTDAHRELCQIHHYSNGDKHYQAMNRLVKQEASQLTPNQQMDLHFSLAKASEEMGHHDQAFSHVEAFNRIRKESLDYTIDRDIALFEQIKIAYSDPIEDNFSEDDRAFSQRMLFIVGMPRSGTTLVEQILACHPLVHGSGELDLIRDYTRAYPWSEGRLSHSQLEVFRQNYRAGIEKLDNSKPRITDKTTLNFLWIGLIKQAFPEARIIHVMRDPMATCWSILKHNFIGDVYTYGCDQQDLAAYYKQYKDLMQFWDQQFPGEIYHLNYESLTESQETETRKLLEYCGLEWDEACLDFHRSARPVATASHAQVRKPMYTGSSEAWKRYAEQLRPLQDALGNQ